MLHGRRVTLIVLRVLTRTNTYSLRGIDRRFNGATGFWAHSLSVQGDAREDVIYARTKNRMSNLYDIFSEGG